VFSRIGENITEGVVFKESHSGQTRFLKDSPAVRSDIAAHFPAIVFKTK